MMQSCMFVLLIVLAVWFSCGLVYINGLKRNIDRQCDELQRQIEEGSGDE